ncbi:MAG: hypothetical protein DMG97_18985 [Acidobacteria bacterium]|nr:MAG: hypothetical protein DMG97_18985 [Acidobacteriota bacterium]
MLPFSSVIFGCPSRSEFQDKQHQWHTHQHESAEGRKTIQKSQKRRLPLQQIERLRLRVHRCIRMRKPMRPKIVVGSEKSGIPDSGNSGTASGSRKS